MYFCKKNIITMNEVTLKLKSDEIRKIRQQKGLSQENMAAEVGLSQSQYSRIEQGDCAVEIDKVVKIAQILEVDFIDILDLGNAQNFYNCSLAGNNIGNTVHYNQDFENERKTFLAHTEELKEQIAELQKILQNLKTA